ncbi:hypothetical protein JZK55_02150 [Dissulfurispira thermophila]|uniref:Uncharacterized protein n=2 Tax=root TaxID=1 RepID=A0A7G1GZE2_9BACT|nr:DUF523 domain-containing protein [Dissulfurispira thermophila]BCB95293.1 hypothetical protein JZK55_02150 [Dissulfurispira thermophila]
MIIVSACLAGFNTRYDNTNCIHPEIVKLVASGNAIPLCPEQLGGLSTPRPTISFINGDGYALLMGKNRVIAIGSDGINYSQNLLNGANEVLRIVKMYNIKKAILKNASPSCGVSRVLVNSKKVDGCGVTTAMLKEIGIMIETVE